MSLFSLALINYRDGGGDITFFGANDTFIFIFSIAIDIKIQFRKIEKVELVQKLAISLKHKNTVHKTSITYILPQHIVKNSKRDIWNLDTQRYCAYSLRNVNIKKVYRNMVVARLSLWHQIFLSLNKDTPIPCDISQIRITTFILK